MVMSRSDRKPIPDRSHHRIVSNGDAPEVTLRQLHYLAAVASEGSFSAAARKCHVSQPALVEQVNKLEARLGTLLLRDRRRSMLTPLGEQVVRRSHHILHAVHDIEQLARTGPVLRIGMIETVAPYLMAAAMAGTADRVVPVQAKTPELVEQLRAGRVDAAVLAQGTVPADLDAESLGEDELLIAMLRDDTHLAGTEEISVEDLHDHEMLLLSDGHCLRDQVSDLCASTRSVLGPLEAASLEMLTEMVARGLGVTVVPAIAAGAVGRNDLVRIARMEGSPKRALMLVTRRGERPVPEGVRQALRTAVVRAQPTTTEAG
jgi:LysR family hydrogen peroxide-inducible transcriptional activator